MQIHSDWFIEQTTRYNTGAINRVRIVQRCNRDCIQYDCRRTALRNRNPHYHNRSRTGSRKGKGRTGDLGPTGSRRGRSHHRRGRSHRRGLPRCLQRQPSRPQTPWPRPAISGRPLANLPSMAPPMTLACRPITSNDRSRQSSTFLLLTPQVMTKTERKREKEKKKWKLVHYSTDFDRPPPLSRFAESLWEWKAVAPPPPSIERVSKWMQDEMYTIYHFVLQT